MKLIEKIDEYLNEENVARNPKTDSVVEKGKDWTLMKSDPYGPNGKYTDFYIVFKSGGSKPTFETLKDAKKYLKDQDYK